MTKSPALSPDERRLARMLKALGNPVRFQIVTYMAEHPTCITREIVAATPLAQSTVSQHLKVLREAGLIEGEIEGPATCYCLSADGLRWLEAHFQAWARRQAACCPAPERATRAGRRC
ncbi:MAG: metalloregulator ArsR/SmtB family transcription factor [Anaerolineales bacterium]|nr:metalloregulator ArsR/SmtB family transcription factor [Anaerolineales bacterium]